MHLLRIQQRSALIPRRQRVPKKNRIRKIPRILRLRRLNRQPTDSNSRSNTPQATHRQSKRRTRKPHRVKPPLNRLFIFMATALYHIQPTTGNSAFLLVIPQPGGGTCGYAFTYRLQPCPTASHQKPNHRPIKNLRPLQRSKMTHPLKNNQLRTPESPPPDTPHVPS